MNVFLGGIVDVIAKSHNITVLTSVNSRRCDGRVMLPGFY